MGCRSLLQGIFPTQGLNPGFPHLQADSLPSEPPGIGTALFFSFWSGSSRHLFCLVVLAKPLRLCKSQWGEERRHPCPVLSERIQPQVWCWTQVFGDAVYRVEEVPFYSCIFYWEFLSRVGVEFCQVPFCILIKWYFFSSLLIWLISQVDFWILYQPWVTGRMVMYISFCILMNSVYHGLYRIFTPVYLRAVFSFSTVPCTIFSTDFCARLMLASSSGLGNVSLLLCFLK